MIKRQHYISEGVLKNFCNETGGLYELLLHQKRLYGTSPINSMCESLTYEHEDIEQNRLENDFSYLEGKTIPRIDRLLNDVIRADNENLDLESIKQEVFNLMPTFLVFYYRSNALLQEYSMGDKKFRIPIMLKKLFNHDYMFELAKIINSNYRFCIVKAKSTFLLSDQYISTTALKIKSIFYDLSNRHIGLKDTMLLIPLSKDYYFVFWHSSGKQVLKENCINRLDEVQNLLFNKTIINNSYTKCVSANESVLRTLSSFWSHQSPSQIFIGHNDNTSSGFIKKKEIFFNKIDKVVYEILTDHLGMSDFFNVKGSDRCPCKSQKLFKNCHMKYIKIAKPIYNGFGEKRYIGEITIDGTSKIELPIDSWGPMSKQYENRN